MEGLKKRTPEKRLKVAQLEEEAEALGKSLGAVGAHLAVLIRHRESTSKRLDDHVEAIALRLRSAEFMSAFAERSAAIQRQIDDAVDSVQARMQALENRVGGGVDTLETKLQQLEEQTLWKVQEFSELLATRVNQEYVE